MATYEALFKLALFCANQARTSVMKDAAREAWRLAVEYQGQAANLGEPPDLGRKPRQPVVRDQVRSSLRRNSPTARRAALTEKQQ
jgi:plasmid stabilization system protein ParE